MVFVCFLCVDKFRHSCLSYFDQVILYSVRSSFVNSFHQRQEKLSNVYVMENSRKGPISLLTIGSPFINFGVYPLGAIKPLLCCNRFYCLIFNDESFLNAFFDSIPLLCVYINVRIYGGVEQ